MGCRIQIKAYKTADSDEVRVVIGFEGDHTETSLLIIDENEKQSRLFTFTSDHLSDYNRVCEYYIDTASNESKQDFAINEFAECDSPLLNKLARYVKVDDRYYNDEELRELIHGLRVIKPYYREGSKNYFIRHLQWHNVNQERFSTPNSKEPEPTVVTPNPQYETWGTW